MSEKDDLWPVALPTKEGDVDPTLGRKMLAGIGDPTGWRTKIIGDQMVRTKGGKPEITATKKKEAPTQMVLTETAYEDRTFYDTRILKATDVSPALTLPPAPGLRSAQ